ncbi:MAG TPA: A/G-specific adenine glycosylase, partial [Thermomicrobiales bacterium]|nr:A/G-specific adenine glycosylase [Thermomicrobiales bacterium]
MFPTEAKDALIAWYLEQGRDLPWRRTRDPYRILVSEIMLQQTQAERVVPKYHQFLQRFPTLEALADAPASEVIRAWAGLGYNRRALNLQRACRSVVERFDGRMPESVDELLTLPGVGPYTAGAIACFAFEQDVGFVDTNIRRVLHRVVHGPEIPSAAVTAREMGELAQRVVPEGRGYVWNQALMELGATVCRARATACEQCPVAPWCAAHGRMADAFARAPAARRGESVPFERTSRYFRGRIIDLLRSAPPRGLSAAEIAESVDPGRTSEDGLWATPYLEGLKCDGLIVAAAASAIRETSVEYDGSETVD